MLALILSSYVAAGRVGGQAQALALAALGVEPVLVPTVLFGRTPGRGPPGGAATEPALFEAVLNGVEAAGVLGRVDAVITGHFSHPEQVRLAARTIDRVRTAPRSGGFIPVPVVVVDPILGDVPQGLYVKPDVAEAVKAQLLQRADILTPNAWELAWLTGLEAVKPAGVLAAARRLPAPALVSSVPVGPDEIGLVWAGTSEAALITHPRFEGVPNGTGDLLTAILAAGLIAGRTPPEAALRAVHAVAIAAAAAAGSAELPIVALGAKVAGDAPGVHVERLP